MCLAAVSANKYLRCMQALVNIVNFLKLIWAVLKNVSLERWLQNCKPGMGKENCYDLLQMAFLFMKALVGTRDERMLPQTVIQ